MFFDLSFKSAILLIFFFHGTVFSGLLLVKGILHKNSSSLWLSLFVLLSTLYISPFMLGYAGWYSKNPYRDILFYIPFQQLFLLPPVLYFYTSALLDKSFRFSRADLIHFLPAVLYLFYSLVVVIGDKLIFKTYYFYSDQRDKDLSPWYQIAGFISMFFYLVLSLRVYYRYKKITYQVVSFADTILFSWVKRFLLVFVMLLVLRFLFFILNPEWAQFGSKFWYYLCFSILCYYISIHGYTNYVQSIIPFNTTLLYEDHDVIGIEKNSEKVLLKNEIDKEEIDRLKLAIEQIMNLEKIFKKQDLTLNDLAQRLDINAKKASQVINQGFDMNFNDMVNHYRTQEVMKILNSDKPNLFTLLAIALDCGFNSKSTFNRAFKKHTSVTPKEYLEKLKLK